MVIATIKRRAIPEGIIVLFGEDSPFFIPKSLLFEFSLPYYEEGTEIDEYLLYELQKINKCYLCRKKALDLLARREHSSFELKAKLSQRKFSKDSINNTIEYLISKNYLSETRYCETVINSRIRKGEGKYLILQRLQQKGISSTLSKKVYEDNVDYDTEKEACEKTFDKLKVKIFDKQLMKIKLSKKGFSSKIINSVFEEEFDL